MTTNWYNGLPETVNAVIAGLPSFSSISQYACFRSTLLINMVEATLIRTRSMFRSGYAYILVTLVTQRASKQSVFFPGCIPASRDCSRHSQSSQWGPVAGYRPIWRRPPPVSWNWLSLKMSPVFILHGSGSLGIYWPPPDRNSTPLGSSHFPSSWIGEIGLLGCLAILVGVPGLFAVPTTG